MRTKLILFVLRQLSRFSLPTLHWLGSLLGWLFYLLPNSNKTNARLNIELCFPEYSDQNRRLLLRDTLIETGKTITEMAALWCWPRERLQPLIRKVSNEQAARKLFDQHNGLIICTPHLGAWELAGLYCSSRFPLTILYKPPRIEDMETFIKNARSRWGGDVVPTDRQGIISLHKALKNKSALGILPDQEPGEGNGQFANFFHIPAYTMTLVQRLAKKNNAPVIFVFAERLAGGQGYHIHFVEALDAIEKQSLEDSTIMLNRSVEKCIHMNPAQYQWTYKRFRMQPDEYISYQ